MKYFILDSNSQQLGPFTVYELKDRGITEDTLVWAEGMADWTPAWKVEELKALLFNHTNATPPPPHADAQPQQSTAQAQPETDFAYQPQAQQEAQKPEKHSSHTGLKIMLAVIVVLLIVMAMTNPSKDEHKRTISDVVSEMFENQVNKADDPFSAGILQLGKLFSDQFTASVLNQFLDYHNYLLFSTTSMSYGEKTYRTSVGVFGHVFTISNEDLEKEIDKRLQFNSSSSSTVITGPDATDDVLDDSDSALEGDLSAQGAGKIVDGVTDIVKDQVKQNTDSATSDALDKVIDGVKELFK